LPREKYLVWNETEGQSSCTVLRWLRGPGERVAAGEDLLEMTGAAGPALVVAPAAGYVYRQFVSSGEVAWRGDLFGLLSDQPYRPPSWRAIQWP
jgi:pyruvate/2-oxoglutarate dehydrogenase complex dihydrolipoamide acyltransferase (E2) component